MSKVSRLPTIAELFPGIEAGMPDAASVAAILAEARNMPGDVYCAGGYEGDTPRDVVHEATRGRLSDHRVTLYVDRVVAGDEVCRDLILAMRRGEVSPGVLPAALHPMLRRWLLVRRFENLYCGAKRGALGTMTAIYGEPCRTCGETLNHTPTCPEW
jgi:hypothetical protein